ncbi:hypothetical protein B0T16DRAFT_393999 [Cercophora newfieldiana]|uniref:NB-ARC domain-containing protein n=1 Tax=Cercophora newfieldiana TaxID=92897 RepID=A0AA39XYR4_9PEZI|nr:hypothetical protein B0T16DRAFT_393999 [Cercophora newfieldiana]
MAAGFNWWSLGISAEKCGRSSLDYRVRTRNDVRELFISLLDSLAISLRNCIELAKAAQADPENARIGVSMLDRKQKETDTTDPRNSQLPDEDSKLGEQFYYIKSSVDSLARISAALRKYGTKFRHERADKLRAGRAGELAEFRIFLIHLVLVGPMQMHLLNWMLYRDTPTRKPAPEKTWAFLTSERRLSPVQERLIEANLIRRNRFDIYLDECRRKSRQDSAPAAPAATKAVAAGRDGQPRPTPSQIHSPDHLPEKELRPRQPPVADSSVQSSRRATDLASSFVVPKNTQERETKSVATKVSQQALKQNYPKCPAAEGTHFWCPFCAQLLDDTYSDPKKDRIWRGHIAEDLCPYVCVYDDCEKPVAEVMYTSSDDWKQHLKDCHSTASWICDACWLGSETPARFEFKDEKEWHDHATATHQGEFDQRDRLVLAEMSCRTALPPVACPLCFDDTALLQPEADKHIIEHLHSFALQALPWENIGPDDDTKASVGSDIGRHVPLANREEIVEDFDWDEPYDLPSLIATTTRHCTNLSAKEVARPVDVALVDLILALQDLSKRYSAFSPDINDEIAACLTQLESIFQSCNGVDNAPADLAADITRRLTSLDALRELAESKLNDTQASMGPENQDWQRGQNYGTINTEFHLPPERPETPPQPFATIPFSRDPDFVDRGDVLDQLRRRCSEPAARVALVGLGGVGKSQLAIEFAHRIAAEQPDVWVFWVYASTHARIEEGFRTIAGTVKLPGRNQPKADIPQLVYSWLSNERNGKWIMILDSADDCDIFYSTTSGNIRDGRPIATYLPQSRNGSIIVTTRDKGLALRLTRRRQTIIEVGPMVLTDALMLLQKKLGSLSDPDVAVDLVQALDLIPLAISQAAAYIQARAPRSSPEKYLAEFRENERKRAWLLGYDGGDLRRDGGASNAVLTTWQISFDYIRARRPSTADLLSLMSYFDRQGIPGWILKRSGISQDTMRASGLAQTEDEELDYNGSTTDGDNIDHEFDNDVAILRDCCLITANEMGDEFEMHGLVQLSTRRWLEESGLQETFKEQFIKRIAAFFPTGEYENWATCRSLFTHVQVALKYRPSENTVETWAKLLHNGGWYAWSQGNYDIAQQMLSEAKKVREEKLGKNDIASLASTSMFALALKDGGKWEEAEKLFIQVMETCKTKLGADHPDTLTSMTNLASTYRNQGRWSEAEMLEVQVMETRKMKLRADHPDTLTSMANLASTYRNQGRWEEAEELEVQVMEARKTKLGADHPDTLRSMSSLASTFWNQGRWSEAEELEVQVMETRKTKLGADHPNTLTSMANLASTYRNQGRWSEAEELEVQVMETRKTKLGADHPDTLTSMSSLASTFWNQGRWSEAEELEVQVMETRKTKLGADHPDTLSSMHNLAFTWRGQGRRADALALMEECAQARRRVLGEEHPYTQSSLATVAKWSS